MTRDRRSVCGGVLEREAKRVEIVRPVAAEVETRGVKIRDEDVVCIEIRGERGIGFMGLARPVIEGKRALSDDVDEQRWRVLPQLGEITGAVVGVALRTGANLSFGLGLARRSRQPRLHEQIGIPAPYAHRISGLAKAVQDFADFGARKTPSRRKLTDHLRVQARSANNKLHAKHGQHERGNRPEFASTTGAGGKPGLDARRARPCRRAPSQRTEQHRHRGKKEEEIDGLGLDVRREPRRVRVDGQHQRTDQQRTFSIKFV